MKKNKQNHVVIITTRWMSIINNEEGQIIPIHCSTDVPFIKEHLSTAKEITEYFRTYPSDHLAPGPDKKGYEYFYHLTDEDEEEAFHVYILPCHSKDKPCSNPEAWFQALIHQFSSPGDDVCMLIHASTDNGNDFKIITTLSGVDDRNLKIKPFAHIGSDSSTLVLSRSTYNDNVTAADIYHCMLLLFSDTSALKKQFKNAWDLFFIGDISIDDLCNAYNELLSATTLIFFNAQLPSIEEFRKLAEGIDDNPENCASINQIVAKF